MTAMPGFLSLLPKPEDRITSIDRYRGWYGTINAFVKDHFKSVVVLKDVFGGIYERVKGAHQEVVDGVISYNAPCHSTVMKAAKTGRYREIYETYLKQSHDQVVIDEVVRRLRRMKTFIETRQSKLIMVASYDFLVIERNNQQLIDLPKVIASMAGIEFIDVSPAIIAAQHECGLYANPNHPGPLGNQILAEKILDRLTR
jgi:hypothetical protein